MFDLYAYFIYLYTWGRVKTSHIKKGREWKKSKKPCHIEQRAGLDDLWRLFHLNDSPSMTGEDNTLYKTLPQTLGLGQNACCIHSLAWVRKASQISVEPSRKPLLIQIWMGCMVELFHCSGSLAFPSCSSSCACILKIHYKALAKQQALRLWMLPLLCNSKNRSSGSNRIKGIRGNAH